MALFSYALGADYKQYKCLISVDFLQSIKIRMKNYGGWGPIGCTEGCIPGTWI